MKQIGIYLSIIDPAIGPAFKKLPYTNAYPQLFEYLLGLGVEPVLVHDQARTYKGNGVFSEYYRVSMTSKGVSYDRVGQDIALSFIYDKARFDAADVAVLNLPGVRDICRDKLRSYEIFPDLHPKTTHFSTEIELSKYLKSHANERVVIKGLDSNEGKEVYIGPAGAYDMSISFPVIVQYFVETSGGYPGLVKGRHDVRVCLFDGDVLCGRLRTPPEGGLLSNIRFGGHNRILSVDELPIDLLELARTVDQRFKNMSAHRYIAADFGYDGERWVLFEINPWPGLVDSNDGTVERMSMHNLASHLARCVDER